MKVSREGAEVTSAGRSRNFRQKQRVNGHWTSIHNLVQKFSGVID